MQPEYKGPSNAAGQTADLGQKTSRPPILSCLSLILALLLQVPLILLLKPYEYGLNAWFGYGIFGLFIGSITAGLATTAMKRNEAPKIIAIFGLIVSALPIILGILGVLYTVIIALVFTTAAR